MRVASTVAERELRSPPPAEPAPGVERELPARRLRFEYAEDFDPVWNRHRPELACAADAVSLLMPYVEPYIVKTVRSALPEVDGELAERAEAYVRQESQHHAQHRRFNDLVRRSAPGVGRVEGWIGRTLDWLARRRSLRFNLAVAAGGETVAFCAARWVEKHLSELFGGADPEPATLFLWHLAEEVEHKEVAFDVYRKAGGRRLTYVAGMVTAAVTLAWFTMLGTLVLLKRSGRLWSPVAHLRLARWTLSFVFELFPVMAVSALPSHHPSQLTDPTWLPTLLDQYDPDTGTIPAWAAGSLFA